MAEVQKRFFFGACLLIYGNKPNARTHIAVDETGKLVCVPLSTNLQFGGRFSRKGKFASTSFTLYVAFIQFAHFGSRNQRRIAPLPPPQAGSIVQVSRSEMKLYADAWSVGPIPALDSHSLGSTIVKARIDSQRKLPPENLLSEDEIRRLAKSAQNLRDRTPILLLYESGCRVGEILGLK